MRVRKAPLLVVVSSANARYRVKHAASWPRATLAVAIVRAGSATKTIAGGVLRYLVSTTILELNSEA